MSFRRSPRNNWIAGFFVYLVSFNPKKAYKPLQNEAEIIIENKAYPDVPMVYTGSAHASDPYRIESSTANHVLGENSDLDLSDPKRWSKDVSLRKMKIIIGL